jgi:polyisoprenoid-binding protein YceI
MKKNILFTLMFIVSTITMNAQTTWKLDAAHSKVSFSVSHMVISEVTGRFNDFDATIVQTKDDLSDSKLTATIKTKSIDTDNEGRDKHLRSADFFDAEKYPEIMFNSKSFEKTGKDTYKITGDLTMHGVTKPVVLDTKFNGTMSDPWGNTKAGFKAEGKVNRKDFGIVWNKTLEAGGLLVGEDIGVTINVEMSKEKK